MRLGQSQKLAIVLTKSHKISQNHNFVRSQFCEDHKFVTSQNCEITITKHYHKFFLITNRDLNTYCTVSLPCSRSRYGSSSSSRRFANHEARAIINPTAWRLWRSSSACCCCWRATFSALTKNRRYRWPCTRCPLRCLYFSWSIDVVVVFIRYVVVWFYYYCTVTMVRYSTSMYGFVIPNKKCDITKVSDRPHKISQNLTKSHFCEITFLWGSQFCEITKLWDHNHKTVRKTPFILLMSKSSHKTCKQNSCMILSK